MLMEFSKIFYGIYGYTARYWGARFCENLKPNDWIALEDFSMKTRVDVDFTHDPEEILDGLESIDHAGFSRSQSSRCCAGNDRPIERCKGKKAILLLASGFDTFSKHTMDQMLSS